MGRSSENYENTPRRQGPTRCLGHQKCMYKARGNRRVAGAERLILRAFADFNVGNGVVFLQNIRWISFRIDGDGVTPESLKIRVLPDNVNNLAKS